MHTDAKDISYDDISTLFETTNAIPTARYVWIDYLRERCPWASALQRRFALHHTAQTRRFRPPETR